MMVLMVFLNFRKVVRFQKKKTMRIEEEKQDKDDRGKREVIGKNNEI